MKLRTRGIAMGLVVMVVFSLFAGGMIISRLSRSLQSQLTYADSALRAQYIAESACNQLIAKTISRPFEQRWFGGNPDAKSELSYGGGLYDYFIQDTPDRPKYVDIWTRATYRDVKRCFFWRFEFHVSLLSGIREFAPVEVLEIDERLFPPKGSANNDARIAEIENLIRQRHEKKSKADQVVAKVIKDPDLENVLTTLGNPPTVPVTSSSAPPKTDDVGNPSPPAQGADVLIGPSPGVKSIYDRIRQAKNEVEAGGPSVIPSFPTTPVSGDPPVVPSPSSEPPNSTVQWPPGAMIEGGGAASMEDPKKGSNLLFTLKGGASIIVPRPGKFSGQTFFRNGKGYVTWDDGTTEVYPQ